MLRTILFFTLIVGTTPCSIAAPSQPRPGQYVLEGDSGTLTIRSDGSNDLYFQIETVGGNCHSCSVSGVIRGTTGHGDSWTADGSDSKCDISFSYSSSSLVVTPITHEACRAYCGARAGFDGAYRIPPTNCTTGERQAQRDRFLQLYQAHRYPQATSTLQMLISQCREFMGWIETDEVRNDLALSQYHSGDFAQCLNTLNETLVGNTKDEEQFKAGNNGLYLTPCDFDNYIGVAKSTWYNKRLCTKAMLNGR